MINCWKNKLHFRPGSDTVLFMCDTGVTSDSDSALCVEPKLSLTKVEQTLSNLMVLLHQTKTSVPIDSGPFFCCS